MQVGGVLIESIKCLPFFLVTIECRDLVPNLLRYLWRIRSLCFEPVTMILSSSTCVVESNILLAGTKMGVTLVQGGDAVAMLRVVSGHAA